MSAALEDGTVPRFYMSNIYEHRLVAYIARATPLGLYLLSLIVLVVSGLRCEWLLLVICAILNVIMWLWLSSTAAFAILGARLARIAQESEWPCDANASLKVPGNPQASPSTWNHAELTMAGAGATNIFTCTGRGNASIQHLIVLTNIEVGEELLAQSLEALSQACGSHNFCIVLAMESNEGRVCHEKLRRLQARFCCRFARVLVSTPPKRTTEINIGSVEGELGMKASKVKWAVSWAVQELNRKGMSFDASSVLLTLAEADCIFHPAYFAHVHSDFCTLQEQDDHHLWTIWQAPKLLFRNHYTVPSVARIWSYISSVFQFGGISSLLVSGQHVPSNAYTLPLKLALGSGSCDDNIIVGDDQYFSKCFYFSLYAALVSVKNILPARPGAQHSSCKRSSGIKALQVRPVFLPVKSRSPTAKDTFWQTCIAHWYQTWHHAEGVAELCYSIMATFDLLKEIPKNSLSVTLSVQILKVTVLPLLIHMVPICQVSAFMALCVRWLCLGRTLDHCPSDVWHTAMKPHMLCSLAGAHLALLPVVVLFVLFIVASYLLLLVVFLQPAERRLKVPGQWTIWDAEDGDVPISPSGKAYDVQRLIGLVLFDWGLLMSPFFLLIGAFAELASYWHVCFGGIGARYIRKTKASYYGTMSAFGPPSWL